MTRLIQPMKNRGINHVKNDDGTVTINGHTFDRESDVEEYLISIPRNDIGV